MMSILNGRLPSIMLTRVGTNRHGKTMLLRSGAAARTYLLLVRFVRLFLGQQLGLADAYRDYKGQQTTWRVYQNGGPVAAWPGTSNHGWGLAADFDTPMNNTGSQMHAFARWFFPLLGWHWTGRAWNEPWHWDFKGIPARITLRNGSRGNLVKLWQGWLYLAGHRHLKLDGIFGPVTSNATKAWQRANRLTADGIVGPKSWKKAGLA
jgi:peptidoglycan hydrolase-like protein with peptidoglycan-binding domain